MAPHSHSCETRFWRGIRLFNQGAFFDAHEVLEDEWRQATEHDRLFLQALIQIAVALHHYSKGNVAGAASLLARGEKNLLGYPEGYRELDLTHLREDIAKWREALAYGRSAPPWPRLVRLDAKIGFR